MPLRTASVLFMLPVALCGAAAESTPPFAWWTTHPMAKVRPFVPVLDSPAKCAYLYAGRNEFGPFRIVPRARSKDLSDCTDRISGRSDIPIESIRLKPIREGMQDYEYLALLGKLEGRKSADSYTDQIIKQPYLWEARPEVFLKVWQELGEALDRAAARSGDKM